MSLRHFTVLLLALPLLANAAPTGHDSTRWDLRPSLTFDALCLLNTLTAETYYQKDYDQLAPRLTPAARESLARLKHVVKDQNGGIISASLCLYYSSVNDTTLDQLLATTADPSAMLAAFRQTAYYDSEGWAVYESIRPDLTIIFRWMKAIRFEDYWREQVLPKIRKRMTTLAGDLPRYNVIKEDEAALGAPLAENRITVYMLYYCLPHGIKITGTRFLTDAAYPFEIVVRNSAHEMMHPPFHLATDTALVAALETLKADSFLMGKVLHHNPAFGYNSFEGFVEEDCVQALEQLTNERLGVADKPRDRWLESDDGMHVFAVALYQVMKAENYNSKHEPFAVFLTRQIRSGRLAPGQIEPLYHTLYPAK
jgi:hypothetical protein